MNQTHLLNRINYLLSIGKYDITLINQTKMLQGVLLAKKKGFKTAFDYDLIMSEIGRLTN